MALTAGEESAWLYWQFAEADQVTSQCLTGKREMANAPKYVAAKHFYRFIRPNAVRVQAKVDGAPGLLASAYLHPADRTLTAVLVNSGSAPASAQVRIPPQPAGLGRFEVYTSDNNRLWQHAMAQPAGGSLAVTVPGYGVVTLYGKGR